MQTLREQGKARRRGRIVDAAIELLLTEGIEGLSMRALSEQAGLSVPTIYNLVGGRDEVLVAVLDRAAALYEAAVATMPTDPVERCLAAVDAWVADLVEHATVARSVIGAGLGPALARHDTAGLRLVAGAVADAVERGKTAGVFAAHADPRPLSRLVAAATGALALEWATAELDDQVFRARAEHGVISLLLGVAGDAERPGLVARLERVQARLTRLDRSAP